MPFQFQEQRNPNIYSTIPTVLHFNKQRKAFLGSKESVCVDVWHFLSKHQMTHQYCQENCNPVQFPELLDKSGKWFFNTSVAEQINAWLQYHSIVQEMLLT